MSIKPSALGAVRLGVALASGSACAQTHTDLGKPESGMKRAMCPGLDGKGGGLTRTHLDRAPTNLTALAKARRDIRPLDRTFATIDGSREAPAHGTRDTPAWGNDYRVKAAQYYWDVPYDPEVVVRAQILSLLEYINRLQVK